MTQLLLSTFAHFEVSQFRAVLQQSKRTIWDDLRLFSYIFFLKGF